jgi:hypothetical protein
VTTSAAVQRGSAIVSIAILLLAAATDRVTWWLWCTAAVAYVIALVTRDPDFGCGLGCLGLLAAVLFSGMLMWSLTDGRPRFAAVYLAWLAAQGGLIIGAARQARLRSQPPFADPPRGPS